ncbi:MAG: creatininase family protein [Candidatus Sericytochromatia bacterium]
MSQLLKLEELSSLDYKNLDRYKTLFLVNLSPIENHGSHLPLGIDLYESAAVIKGISERFKIDYPDWTIVICPDLTLGLGTMLGQGSINIRQRVLRDFLIDYLSSFAKRGFKHILLSGYHGEIRHCSTIDEAVSYVNKKYNSKIVSPFGYYVSNILSKKIEMKDPELNKIYKSNVGDIHGGMIETSFMLHINKDLVGEYKNLKRINILEKNFFKKIVALKDSYKSGYFGNPAVASPEIGEMVLKESVDNFYYVLDKSIKEPDFIHEVKSLGYKKVYLRTDFFRYISFFLLLFSGLLLLKNKSTNSSLKNEINR